MGRWTRRRRVPRLARSNNSNQAGAGNLPGLSCLIAEGYIVTNKSMVDPDKKSKKTSLELSERTGPLSDEQHPHSPQLKPVIDEKRTGLQTRDSHSIIEKKKL